jgi:hypothetical protein
MEGNEAAYLGRSRLHVNIGANCPSTDLQDQDVDCLDLQVTRNSISKEISTIQQPSRYTRDTHTMLHVISNTPLNLSLS